MKRIKILDSCRGLAALVVVFHHVFTRFGYLFPHLPEMRFFSLLNFISNLNVEAVLFFFLLSGFSIRLSLKNGMPVHKPLFNEYLYKRFKRILPLYFIALIFTFICGMMIHAIDRPDYSIKNLLGNLFFLQVSKDYKGYWFPPYGENGPLWSLSFEMFYYIFFPLFIYLLMRIFRWDRLVLRNQRIILCIAFVLSVTCIIINNSFFFPYIAFSKLFVVWYSGFFLANLYLEKKLEFDINFMLSLILVLLSGALVFLKRSDSLVGLLMGLSIGTLFYFGCIVRKRLPAHFMDGMEKAFNFLFYQLGKGSYALYLLHFPLILVLQTYANMNIWIVILSMALLAFTCIRLEEFFVKKKFLLLRLRYIR